MLMEPRNGMDEIMAFLAFLFGEYSVLEEKAQRFLGELEEPFADVIHGRFQLLSGFGRLVHLKCVTCGKGPNPPVFTRSGLRMSFLRNKDVIAAANQPETFFSRRRKLRTGGGCQRRSHGESGSASSIKPAETSGRPASWKHSGCRRNATARQK